MKSNYFTLLLVGAAICIAFLVGYSLNDTPQTTSPAEYIYWEEDSTVSEESLTSAWDDDSAKTSTVTSETVSSRAAGITTPNKKSSSKSGSSKNTSSKSTSSKVNSSKVYLSSSISSDNFYEEDDPPQPERPSSKEESPKPDPNAIININTASLEELCTLDGIGPVLGQRIIDFRTNSGGFTQIEEIMAVSGIGEKKFAAIRDRITI